MKSLLLLSVLIIVGCGQSTETDQPKLACQEARLVIEGTVHGRWFQSINRIDPLHGTGHIGSTVNYLNGEYQSWGYSVDSTAVTSDLESDTHEVEWQLQSDGSTKAEGRFQLKFNGSKSDVVELDDDLVLYLLPPYEG